jgi:hypothetical protein
MVTLPLLIIEATRLCYESSMLTSGSGRIYLEENQAFNPQKVMPEGRISNNTGFNELFILGVC